MAMFAEAVVECSTPRTSFPNTKAHFSPGFGDQSFNMMLDSVCSITAIWKPSERNTSIAFKADSWPLQGTCSEEPSALLRMSLCGGFTVYPHKSMPSIRNASPVRKKAPTFCPERMFSNTKRTASFGASAYASEDSR